MCGSSTTVDDYLSALGDRLRGPARLRGDLLREARDSLVDAVEAYTREGLDGPSAQRRAVVEFGDPDELVPAYQAELGDAALRHFAVRAAAVALLALAAGDLTWKGSSWAGSGLPPNGFLLLAGSLDRLWAGCALLALAGFLWVTWNARRGRSGPPALTRLLSFGLAGALAAAVLAGTGVFVWSVELWEAARTWPPMIVGGVAAAAGFLWLARAARYSLIASR